jgi:hypothetical protein
MLSPVMETIFWEFNALYLTRLRSYKIARPSQTKTFELRESEIGIKELERRL